MFTCANCNSRHTDGTHCSVCKLHYDFQCSGVTEIGYRKLGDRKNSWRCLKCKNFGLGDSQSPRPTSPLPGQLDNIQDQLNKITLQLAPLTSLVEDIKIMKEDIRSLSESLEMAHETVRNFSCTVSELQCRLSEVEKVASDVPILQSEIVRLKEELNHRDQWARANNIEIKGIPEKKNENLYMVAQKIAELNNTEIKKEEINYIARIPTRLPDACKSIVISFNNRYRKEDFISATRKNKKLNLTDMGFAAGGQFYVNDHLTQLNKNLLSKARSLAKNCTFKYIWVKHCKIMARKSDTSRIFFIKSEKDLTLIT
ncbi:uncharacterized protein ACR2FA_009045 [Aphomia sociella]